MTTASVTDGDAACAVPAALGPTTVRKMALTRLAREMETSRMSPMANTVGQRFVDLHVADDAEEFGLGDAARTLRQRLPLGTQSIDKFEKLFLLFRRLVHKRLGTDLLEKSNRLHQ